MELTGHEVVERAALAEQRVDALHRRVAFQQPVHAQALSSLAEPGRKHDGEGDLVDYSWALELQHPRSPVIDASGHVS